MTMIFISIIVYLAQYCPVGACLPLNSVSFHFYLVIKTKDFKMTTESNHTVEDGEHDTGPSVIFFIVCSFGLGALMRHGMKFIPIRMAYTVVLLLLGIIFGLISNVVPELEKYTELVDASPHLIMHIFFPVLIFESAFALDFHTFKKSFFQVLLLAVPGLALSSLLTCIMAQYLFDYNWDWNIGMMFGALVSATDPVAVVAILREVGASKKLSMLIEGESLLNDGAAIVMFNIFLILATTTEGLTGGGIVVYFLKVAIGGPAFGLLMAGISIFCLSQVFNDVYVEITITLAATYSTFYIGESLLGVSGVLAVVVLGIVMSSMKTSISPEVEDFLHRFWETLAYLANTLIFITVGVVIAKKAISLIFGMDWFYMIALYLGLQVIRGTVTLLFSPILKRIGYGLTWQEGLVLSWGGLRGAVGLALGLLVMEDDKLDLEKVRVKVLIHVSGIVFLTLLINATTIPYLLKTLGMNDVSTAKRMAMASAIRHLQELRQKTLNMLKTDRFLADSDWELVEKSCEIHAPYKTSKDEIELEQSMKIRPKSICPDCHAKLPIQPTPKEFREMTNEAILRYLKAEKLSYWRQFEQGMVSQDAVRKLQGYTDVASDKKGEFLNLDEIKESWEIPTWLIKIKKFIQRIVENVPRCCSTHPFVKGSFRIVISKPFNYFIFVIVILDMINWTLSFVSERTNTWLEYKIIFRSINVSFVGIYILEFIVKVLTQRTGYFKIIWQILSVFIVIHGIIDVCLEFFLPTSTDFYNEVILTFIAFRIFRLLRLLEMLLPVLLKYVDYQMTAGISNGYDIGRGFVAGEEEVRKLIDRMVDNTDCASYLKQYCDSSKLDVIKCLGILQKEFPQIALSVKTRQAARSVLNSLRDGIHRLLEDGVLQDSETEKLNHTVETNMKKLLNLPTSIPVPPPDKMLNNVTWLQEDQETIDYIKTRAQLVNYDHDDALVREGDPSNGIYIIVSGLVRFSRSKKGKHNNKTEDKVMDFMSTGSIIGEMGLLTHGNRMASVVCETAVQALFISSADMEQAFNEFDDVEPSLEYRLWKVCATRLAVGVLLDQPSYQGYTREKVKLTLESAYVVDGENFAINSKMADVVLIHGHAQNSFTKEDYHGPCYIPWTCLKLDFKVDKITKPIMLIIPSEAGDSMTQAPTYRRQSYHPEALKASLSDGDKLCLKHAAKHRHDLESKKKAVKFKHRSTSRVGALNVEDLEMNGIVSDGKVRPKNTITEQIEEETPQVVVHLENQKNHHNSSNVSQPLVTEAPQNLQLKNIPVHQLQEEIPSRTDQQLIRSGNSLQSNMNDASFVSETLEDQPSNSSDNTNTYLQLNISDEINDIPKISDIQAVNITSPTLPIISESEQIADQKIHNTSQIPETTHATHNHVPETTHATPNHVSVISHKHKSRKK